MCIRDSAAPDTAKRSCGGPFDDVVHSIARCRKRSPLLADLGVYMETSVANIGTQSKRELLFNVHSIGAD